MAIGQTHGRYAACANTHLGRSGHFWQNRYFSCAVEDLWAAAGYVERNPVRAELVEEAADWPWSSARAYALSAADPLLGAGEASWLPRAEQWRKMLSAQTMSEAELQLRVNTYRGRPVGSASFVQEAEQKLSRSLHPRKGGQAAQDTAGGSAVGSGLCRVIQMAAKHAGCPWFLRGKVYNGVMVVNDRDLDNIAWYIGGANFGTMKGTVILAGRTARIVQWTPTSITVVPTVPWTTAPMSTLLTVKTASGTSTSYGVGIAPAIRTRVFGQCTWLCAYKRLAMGKSPSPTAYATTGYINAAYAPKIADQFQWQGRHTAIVTQVSGPVYTTGGYKTWTIRVAEHNAACTNSSNTYSTTFQTRTTTSGTFVTRFPQSSVPSFGSSTVYYR